LYYPYRCARDDYSEGILLDANENSLHYFIHRDQVEKKAELDETEGLCLYRYPSSSHVPIGKSKITDIHENQQQSERLLYGAVCRGFTP